MTLDKAIKHCEEKAEELRVKAEELRDIGEYTSSPKYPYNVPVKDCLECAREHEQLAEWLKDYKRLLEERTSYWVDDERGTTCHNCGSLSRRWSKFCPDCGAQMDKERKINPFDHRGITEI